MDIDLGDGLCYEIFNVKVTHNHEVDKVARLLSEKYKSWFLLKIRQHIKSLPTVVLF
jgi:hypothetical protein